MRAIEINSKNWRFAKVLVIYISYSQILVYLLMGNYKLNKVIDYYLLLRGN